MKYRIFALLLLLFPHSAAAEELGCSATARSLHLACGYDVKDDYLTSIAACVDAESAMCWVTSHMTPISVKIIQADPK